MSAAVDRDEELIDLQQSVLALRLQEGYLDGAIERRKKAASEESEHMVHIHDLTLKVTGLVVKLGLDRPSE